MLKVHSLGNAIRLEVRRRLPVVLFNLGHEVLGWSIVKAIVENALEALLCMVPVLSVERLKTRVKLVEEQTIRIFQTDFSRRVRSVRLQCPKATQMLSWSGWGSMLPVG